MHNLSNYQRRKLLENSNVEKLTDNFVVYTAKFKERAVDLFIAGTAPKDIFLRFNIPIHYFDDPDYCKSCLKRWKKKYDELGKGCFQIDRRGIHSSGRPKKENLNDLTYEELQAIVKIQRGVIEELKKKKALAKKK